MEGNNQTTASSSGYAYHGQDNDKISNSASSLGLTVSIKTENEVLTSTKNAHQQNPP